MAHLKKRVYFCKYILEEMRKYSFKEKLQMKKEEFTEENTYLIHS